MILPTMGGVGTIASTAGAYCVEVLVGRGAIDRVILDSGFTNHTFLSRMSYFKNVLTSSRAILKSYLE
jgi:hypothetical protein